MRISKTFVTVDTIIFRKLGKLVDVLLIKRKNPPFQNRWAIPGGFVDENEDLEVAAIRELKEETGIIVNALIQVAAFGKPLRDPRGHMISIAFVAIISTEVEAIAADDAAEARWFSIEALPELAFDHGEILTAARNKLNL